ncbi:MAG: peptide ABC transporter substrate-binding protein [Anaerolinea sp.]|nr:peptide ABC transporter substrate-binding protein [Anaerolinea sp.]
MNTKRWALIALFVMLGALILAACQPQTETVTVEVTRLVTETVEIAGETVEVTRVVTETIVETVTVVQEPAPAVEGPKDLVVCQAQEPDTLYPYGGSMLAARAVQHAIFTNYQTQLSFGYQADGLEKLPSIADGDAVVNEVEVQPGDMVRDVTDTVVAWGEGITVENAAGEEVIFDGNPVMMKQLVVDFIMLPTVYSDGTPVPATDSVYSFNLAGDPDTPTTKYAFERTASYEATGDLSVRWTGLPGFMDSTYFANFWVPYPEHLWGGYTAAEMLQAEDVSRMPVGDGAFRVVEWVPGDSIYLEKNEFYYLEGLPYLDSVTFKFIPDTNQLIAQLLSGQCDIGTQDGMAVDQSPFLIEAEANGLLVPYFQTGTVYEHIDFAVDTYGDYRDTRPDWFEDARVRQAMTLCTNRDSMVDNIMYGRSEVIHTYVPSVHPLYPEGLTEWTFNPEAGIALLEEVGFIDSDGDGIREYYSANVANNDNSDPASWDGTPFKVTLGTTAGNAMRQQLTQIFKENMKECGIEVDLYYVPSSEWFANGPEGVLFGRRYDLGEFAWLTGVEPSCNLYGGWNIPGPPEDVDEDGNALYSSAWGGQNQTGWKNAEFDAACQLALGSLPGTEGYETGHKQAQVIFSENVPVIPLFLRLKVAAARPEIVNFGVDPTQNSELYNIYEIDIQR